MEKITAVFNTVVDFIADHPKTSLAIAAAVFIVGAVLR